jgi:dipeptidyl aminopeptidase/acylaminoacyl peptidase
VVADDAGFRVVLLDLGTPRSTTLVEQAEEWLADPELSPDGQTVVFSATDERDETFGLSAVSRDGTGLRRLTAPPSTDDELVADIAPSWAPDGRTLLFTRVRTTFTDEQLHGDLLTVPADGGGATALPGGSNALDADWSPDGTFVVAAAGPVDLARHHPRQPGRRQAGRGRAGPDPQQRGQRAPHRRPRRVVRPRRVSAQPCVPLRTSRRMSASTASKALRAAMSTGSHTGAKGGA